MGAVTALGSTLERDLEGPAGRPVRHPRPVSLRRLGLPHPDGGRGRRDPGRLPDAGGAAAHVAGRPHGRGRRPRGPRGSGARPLPRGSDAPRRHSRRRHVGPDRLGSVLRAVPAGPQGAAVEGPQPPARLDHRPGRPEVRPRGHQIHDHDRLLVVGQRPRLRVRRHRRRPRRRRRHRRIGRPRPADLRGLQLPAVGGSGPVPSVRPRPQGPVDRRSRRDPGPRGGGARPAPGSADRGRAQGLRRDLRRVPHDRAGSVGSGGRPHDLGRARELGRRTPEASTTSTRTARPRPRTTRPRRRRSRRRSANGRARSRSRPSSP